MSSLSGIDFEETINLIRKRLSGPMPGFKTQLIMAPVPRPGTSPINAVDNFCSKAGILILLYPISGVPFLVLTRRTECVESHKGQISLPGGRQEPAETIQQTALREMAEELGVSVESFKILGSLTPLYIPSSNYCIYPTVAYSVERPVFHPSREEVAEVIEVSLDHLLNPENARREIRKLKSEKIEVPYFFCEGHKIWGATAMVLAEFVEIVREVLKYKKEEQHRMNGCSR